MSSDRMVPPIVSSIIVYLALWLGLSSAFAQSYRGRPIVLVARQENHPTIGFPSNFGSAQFMGDAVHWIAQDNTATRRGLYFGKGAGITGHLLPGETTLPDGLGVIDSVAFNFRNRSSDGSAIISVTAADGAVVYVSVDAEGNVAQRFDGSAQTMPNSGGLSFSRLGEAHAVDGKVAFIGFHRNAAGMDDFRGVYVLDGDDLNVIADTTMSVADLGPFDGSSSQVGFDGTRVVYWGVYGTEGDLTEGIFTSTVGGTVEVIAKEGDVIPGTSMVMNRFQSPPSVANGDVYFVAFNEAFQGHVLRWSEGTVELLAKVGDMVGGATITQLSAWSVDASGSTVYVDAMLDTQSVILAKTVGSPLEVAIDNSVLPGFGQVFRVLDVEEDRLVFGDRLNIYATIETPARPVIIQQLESAVYEPGESVSLEVKAVGEGELTYEWSFNNTVIDHSGATLTIADFQPSDAGQYRVTVSNANGKAFAPTVTLGINSAPFIAQTFPAVHPIQAGFPLTIGVTAVGQAPLTYEWSKNGVVLETQTNAILRIQEAKASDSGQYLLTISNALGDATTEPFDVVVNPAPLNPAFAGKRFATVLDLPATIEGLEVSGFRQAFPHPDGVAIGFYDSAIVDLGVLLLNASGAPEMLISLEAINQAMGTNYTNVFLNGSSPSGRLLLSTTLNGGNASGVFVREPDGSLTTIAMNGLSIGERSFVGVNGLQIGDEAVIFAATPDRSQSALLRHDSSGVSLILDVEAPLPLEGFVLKAPALYGFDGGSFQLFSYNSDFTASALFDVAADGAITPIVAQGDPLTGGGAVGQIGGLVSFGGERYAFDFAGKLLKLGDRTATLAFETGAAAADGTLSAFAFVDHVLSDRVIVSGNFHDASGVRRGLLGWDGTTLTPLLVPTHFDERRVQSAAFHSVAPDGTLWAQITFNDSSVHLVANVGESVDVPGSGSTDELPSLNPELLPNGVGLRLTVPTGWTLQKTPDLVSPWETVPGTGTVEVTIERDQTFFRLAK